MAEIVRVVAQGEVIEAELTRSSNRKALSIVVEPSAAVRVLAPDNTAIERVAAVVQKRARWIAKQQQFFRQHTLLERPRQYISGEAFWYLGRQYMLQVLHHHSPSVKLIQGRLAVSLNNPQPSLVKTAIDKDFRRRLQSIVEAVLREIAVVYPDLPQPRLLRYQEMATKWGSCAPGGTITLNPRLIALPKACIRYVTIHEVCHLVHPKHDKAFYALQSRIMPQWPLWLDMLNKGSAAALRH